MHEHPRETTFIGNLPLYLPVISDANGASNIIFIYEMDSLLTVVSRRYTAVNSVPSQYFKECRNKDNLTIARPNGLHQNEVTKVISFEGIQNAVASSKLNYGKFDYAVGDKRITINFPIELLSINSDRANYANDNGQTTWQAVSGQVPIYLPSASADCEGITPGYIAFRSMSGLHEFVYLFGTTISRVAMQDYAYTA